MPIIDLYTSIHNYLAFRRVMQQGAITKIDRKIRKRLTDIFSLDERNENSRLYLFLFRCMTIDNNILTIQSMNEEERMVFKERMVQILQDTIKTKIINFINISKQNENTINYLKISDMENIFQELIDNDYIDELQEIMNNFTLEYFKEKADEVATPIIDRTTYKSIMKVIKVIVIGYVNKDRFDLYKEELLGVIPKDIADIANPSHIQNVMENFMTNVVHEINKQLNHTENFVTRAILNPFVFLRDIGNFVWNHVNKAANSIQKQITENSETNIILTHIQEFFLNVEKIEPNSDSGEPPIFSKSELKEVIDKIILLSSNDPNSVSGTYLHNVLENLKNMIVMFQDRKLMETISTRRIMILNMYKKRSVSVDQRELRKGLNNSLLLERSASTSGRYYTRKFKKNKRPRKYKYIKEKKRTPLSHPISNGSKYYTSRRATSSRYIPINMNDSNTNSYTNSNENIQSI